MILVHGGGKQSTAWMWPLLLFLLGKNAKVRVKGKMHPGQKQLYYGDNTTSVLCKADTMELMKTTWPTHRAGELMLRLLISQRSLRVMMYLATSSQALEKNFERRTLSTAAPIPPNCGSDMKFFLHLRWNLSCPVWKRPTVNHYYTWWCKRWNEKLSAAP